MSCKKIKDKSKKIKVFSIFAVRSEIRTARLQDCMTARLISPDGRGERKVPTCYVGIVSSQTAGVASSAIQ